MAKDSLKCKSEMDFDEDFVFEKIRQRIVSLEYEKVTHKKYNKMSKNGKFFLIYYILLNLEYILIEHFDDTEDDKEIHVNEDIRNKDVFL